MEDREIRIKTIKRKYGYLQVQALATKTDQIELHRLKNEFKSSERAKHFRFVMK